MMAITRRTALATGAALAALAAAGCDAGGPGNTGAATRVLRRGNVAEPDTLDPQKYSLIVENQIHQDLWLGLVVLAPNGDLLPGAAESWTTNADSTVWTFRLREGLAWSDGEPMTADDAVAGMQRAFDPATQAPFANLAYHIKNARAVNIENAPPETLGVRAIDPRTVEITLEAPSPLILRLLSLPLLTPVPRHTIARYGAGWTQAGRMVTSGAYTLTTWTANDRIVLTKNPRFHDAAHVWFESVEFYPTDDDAAALRRFRAGEIDLNLRFATGQIEWLRENLDGQFVTYLGNSLFYLVLNHKDARFADARVRRALSLALDRETTVATLSRSGEAPAYRITPPPAAAGGPEPAHPFRAMPMEARLAEARRLMAEAGYGPGKPLRFVHRHRAGDLNRRVAVACQSAWASIGAEAELSQADVKTHYQLLREHDFQSADAGWLSPPDPEYFLFLLLSASTEVNYGRYANAAFDAAADAASRLLDQQERLAAYAAVEAIALADDAFIPLFFNTNRALVSPRLEGLEPNGQGLHSTRWMRFKDQPA